MSPFHLHLLIALVAALTAGQQQVVDQPNLPVLFSFSQPSHNVAVFRGADLQRAIASGAVRGFGGAGGLGLHSGVGVGHRLAVHQTPALVAPAPALVHSTPVIPVARPTVPVYHPPTRVVSPVVHQSHPAVVATPATTATYVDPYYSELADYSFEYGVADSISGSQFGDQESRSGGLTQGQYQVALPDGRLQTVTYTVDGPSGYVANVEYSGEAVFPDLVSP